MRKTVATTLLALILFSGFPGSFLAPPFFQQGKVVDKSMTDAEASFALPTARAAAKTKTIVFYVGSLASTTQVASAATTTFTFTIALPDMVASTQPIRSAYISYNTWQNGTQGITASSFTLRKQGGSAQSLTGPLLTGLQTSQQLSVRLNATAAMQTIIGNASGTYAMIFTSNITGPGRIAEGAELYITYDYDPLASTQVNTAYTYVYASSSQLGTTAVTSAAFNFNLPENSVTSTFAVGASTTNQLWIEYRGFIATSTNITASVGWNAEATSAVAFTQTTQQFSYIMLVPPITASISPNSGNTFKMIASGLGAISAPNAIAVVTYTYNFSASTKLRKTVQMLLQQSTSTLSASTTNATGTINIPETTPSSTNAFVMGRFSITTSSNPGINATIMTTTCVAPTTTAITIGTQTTKNTGYPVLIWNLSPSSSVNAAGNWNVCSIFTRSAVANIPGIQLFLSYDYANNMAGGSRFNSTISFLGASHMSPTGTAFAAAGISSTIANASATASMAWLDAQFDNNAAGTVSQALTLGIAGTTNSFTFVASNSTARRQGATWSATSSSGYGANVLTTVQCSVSCVNDAAYMVLGQTDMIAANFTQAHYHWRNDTGSETSATAAANEDATTSTVVGIVSRLRIEVNNAGDATSSAAFRLEYQKNATSGAWTQLATTTLGTAEWQMSTSSQASLDATSTTNIATSTGGTTDANISFLAGEIVASSSRNQTATYTLSGIQFTEQEFTIKATANAATGSLYYFRVSNAGSALTTYTIYPSMTPVAAVPTVSTPVLNGGSNVTLTPNATTSVTVAASTTDPGGPGNIVSATGTIYRTGAASSCQADDQNCYQLSNANCVFSGSTSTVTCTAGLWYFAQSTGVPSSTFPSDSWTGAITVTNVGGGTATATSTTKNVNVLTAINVTTTTVNYGTLNASSTSGSLNQMNTVANAGNSSATLQISGTALTLGVNNIATTSQHYASSSFTYGGSEQALSGIPATITGVKLPNPPANQAWTNTTPLPTALELLGAAASPSGTLYIVGGANPSGTTSTTYFAPFNIDGTVGTFATTTVLPYKLSQFGDLIVSNGFLYVIGGAAPTGVTSSVLYARINTDNSIGTWNLTSPLPGIRAVLGTALCNNYLYAIGGSTLGGGSTGAVSTTYYAAINADGSVAAWSSTTALPNALDKIFPVSQNGYIYILGGQPVNSTVTSTVLYAKCNSDGTITSWLNGTPLEYGIEGQAETGDANILFSLGGDATGLGGDSSTVSYVPINPGGGANGQGGQNLPKLPQLGTSRNAAVMYNGKIYSIGGKPPNDTSTIAYMPIPNQNLYWGVQVSNGLPTGTYSGTINYTAVFAP